MDEKGRQRHPQGQWLAQHQPSMKQIMTIMAERDAAIQERNLAMSEKNTALAERDIALLQRDSAIAERNSALIERDNAIATIQLRENSMTDNTNNTPPPSCPRGGGGGGGGGSAVFLSDPKPAKPKRTKRPKAAKTPSKSSKKPKLERDDLNKVLYWEHGREIKHEWKDHDLGLNQVTYDDSTMPIPVCSCTGVFRACYKWGNGGWQSSCCTTTMSAYPLPSVPNKRHARIGGRKMSGNVFNKLISRLAGEGHDLSDPVDLKEHWAKHGTNRYITIK